MIKLYSRKQHTGNSVYINPVEVDAPIGSCAGRDESVSMFAWRGQRGTCRCQIPNHICGFLFAKN